ncbi:HU domain-containing protein [Adhaeribacter radiodurans]|uniref:HU-CCDC81 and SPOR domain-containing protein n=1 Tax=Adhaeribacter radiodurans TaxID=2745197 RepID=A0A7L7L6F6_9BACT|nr:SPOR domain-containing protein [Adhaeribacter radiodurans]QMU28421.1 HU-CCDC81 and SPOR domain-containing protein [Adhaeribacter radiodurans]
MVLEHIQKLLFDHDCVIMPDFGGLITHYEPAKIHPIRHTFLPPAKRVAFNEKLKLNDGLLISTLAYNYKLSAEEAQLQVMHFVHELQRELNQNRRFDLQGIGIFRLNEESKVIFEYVENENYLSDSFGLPELISKPIIASEPVILRTLLKDQSVKSKKGFRNKVRQYYRAAAALMIGGVVVTGLYLLSLQTDYNISAINPITLFQPTSETISTLKEPVNVDDSSTIDNTVVDLTTDDTNLGSYEDSPSSTDSDIIIASTSASSANKEIGEVNTTPEKSLEEVKTDNAEEKNQKVLKKVSIAPGEAVLISARASATKNSPAKAPQKVNTSTEPVEVKRNFSIDEINAALGKEATGSKSESTNTVKSTATASTTTPKVNPPAKVTERKESTAKANIPATINTTSERFYIIVNGYSNYESAERNRKIIAKKGRPGKIIAPFGDAKLYRIAIAEYTSREQALQNLPALKNKYGNTIWILKR